MCFGGGRLVVEFHKLLLCGRNTELCQNKQRESVAQKQNLTCLGTSFLTASSSPRNTSSFFPFFLSALVSAMCLRGQPTSPFSTPHQQKNTKKIYWKAERTFCAIATGLRLVDLGPKLMCEQFKERGRGGGKRRRQGIQIRPNPNCLGRDLVPVLTPWTESFLPICQIVRLWSLQRFPTLLPTKNVVCKSGDSVMSILKLRTHDWISFAADSNDSNGASPSPSPPSSLDGSINPLCSGFASPLSNRSTDLAARRAACASSPDTLESGGEIGMVIADGGGKQGYDSESQHRERVTVTVGVGWRVGAVGIV